MNWKASWKYYLLFFFCLVLLSAYLFAPMWLRPSARKTNYDIMYARYKADSMELEQVRRMYDQEITRSFYKVQMLEHSIAKTDEMINRLLNEGSQEIPSVNIDTLDAVQRFDYISDYFKAR